MLLKKTFIAGIYKTNTMFLTTSTLTTSSLLSVMVE